MISRAAYLFIFSFTGRWPITKGWGGGLTSGSLQYRFIQVSHAGLLASLKKRPVVCNCRIPCCRFKSVGAFCFSLMFYCNACWHWTPFFSLL